MFRNVNGQHNFLILKLAIKSLGFSLSDDRSHQTVPKWKNNKFWRLACSPSLLLIGQTGKAVLTRGGLWPCSQHDVILAVDDMGKKCNWPIGAEQGVKGNLRDKIQRWNSHQNKWIKLWVVETKLIKQWGLFWPHN